MALDKHAPERMKEITIRSTNPWFTNKVKDKKKAVRRREKIWQKYKCPEHWRALQVARKEYKILLTQVKTTKINKKIDNCHKDAKELYKLVVYLTGTATKNPLPPGKTDNQLAEDFAKFFMNKIQTIRDNLADHPLYKPEPTNILKFDTFKKLSEEDVRKLISKMKTKSCELDVLPTHILKEILDHLLPTITKIINMSLTQGIFINKWKNALVSPLLKKKGMELILKSYRLVSNLSFLSKVVESMALDQMNNHCEHHNIIPDYQLAYRANYSCETALVMLVNDVLWFYENQEAMQIIAINLSAAFDMLDQDLLLSVLQKRVGINGNAFNWCESYLRPRTCQVNIGKAYSTKKNLTFSVPQGSCPGPWYYLVYASTLQCVVEKPITINGCANDHILKDKFKINDVMDKRRCKENLEKCIVNVKNWMDENCLKMNDDKTAYIVFVSNKMAKKIQTQSISINGININKREGIQYLGAWLDEHLTLREHIKRKCRITMVNLQCIHLIRQYLTQDTTQTLVLGIVMSHLDYSNAIFSGLPDKDMANLQRIQNAGAKLVLQKDKLASQQNAHMHYTGSLFKRELTIRS